MTRMTSHAFALLALGAGLLLPAAGLGAQELTREQLVDGVYQQFGEEGIESFRSDFIEIVESYQGVGNLTGNEQVRLRLDDAKQRLSEVPAEDLALLMAAGVELDELLTAVRTLRDLLAESSVMEAMTDTPGLPTASYSGLCGSTRNNTTVVFAAQTALQAAELVWSVASRGCDQVAVAGGFGGNTSLACTAADATLFAAKAVLGFLFCDADIDSAEIEGSYERLGHLHDDVQCKFPDVVTVSRMGHGCNGIDDDCSGTIDECDEDVFPPVVHIDAAVSNVWFRDLTEASAAVGQAVLAFDDCDQTSVDPPVLAGVCDGVTASVTARDLCGNQAQTSLEVKVDGTPPSIVIDPAIQGACFISVDAAEAALLAATTITDDCTSPGEVDVRLDSTVTPCSLRLRIEAIDRAGLRSVSEVSVRVDPELPVVEIERLLLGFRGAPLGFQTPACYDSVSEAEASVLAVTRFSDDCSASELIDQTVASAGPACELEVTATGVDECTNQNSDTVVVRVDDEAPMVSCSVGIDELWPPNHEMIDVDLQFNTSDNCGDEPMVELLVTSDEAADLATLVIEPLDPAAPCSTASISSARVDMPDAEIIRDLTDGSLVGIRLRAERAAGPPNSSNSGNGRVYRITVRAKDLCGNEDAAVCDVTVPVECGTAAVDDGQYHDPRLPMCPAAGAPIPVSNTQLSDDRGLPDLPSRLRAQQLRN